MRIQIVSDLHLEMGHMDLPRTEADCVVLAGDTHVGVRGVEWAAEQVTDSPVLYVLGNHEYYKHAYPKLLAKLRAAAAGTNVHVLENEEVTLGDVVFVGCTLWTDFRLTGDQRLNGAAAHKVMSDYKRIRVSPKYRRLRPEDTVAIHRKSVAFLSDVRVRNPEAREVVVVTHHAPSARSVAESDRRDDLSSAYASNLEGLIERVRPAVWIHGHTHIKTDYLIGRTRVLSNPRGYVDELVEGFEPDFCVEV